MRPRVIFYTVLTFSWRRRSRRLRWSPSAVYFQIYVHILSVINQSTLTFIIRVDTRFVRPEFHQHRAVEPLSHPFNHAQGGRGHFPNVFGRREIARQLHHTSCFPTHFWPRSSCQPWRRKIYIYFYINRFIITQTVNISLKWNYRGTYKAGRGLPPRWTCFHVTPCPSLTQAGACSASVGRRHEIVTITLHPWPCARWQPVTSEKAAAELLLPS